MLHVCVHTCQTKPNYFIFLLNICSFFSKFSKHVLCVSSFISHPRTLLLNTHNLRPLVFNLLFFPFTLVLPQLSLTLFFFPLLLFICHSCCLNCLSGSIRLSKQQCCTVPACDKYLWCSPPHPSSPLPLSPVSLGSSLLFFLFLPFLLLEFRERNYHWGTHRMIKRSPVNTMSSLPPSQYQYGHWVTHLFGHPRSLLTSKLLHFCGNKRKNSLCK